ncbi:hypothetical protein D3C86_2171860 [compost metagenome]
MQQSGYVEGGLAVTGSPITNGAAINYILAGTNKFTVGPATNGTNTAGKVYNYLALRAN